MNIFKNDIKSTSSTNNNIESINNDTYSLEKLEIMKGSFDRSRAFGWRIWGHGSLSWQEGADIRTCLQPCCGRGKLLLLQVSGSQLKSCSLQPGCPHRPCYIHMSRLLSAVLRIRFLQHIVALIKGCRLGLGYHVTGCYRCVLSEHPWKGTR